MTTSEYKPIFGKWIIINNKLTRNQWKDKKMWEVEKLPNPKTVLIVGVRTLQNGTVLYDEDTGITFERNSKEDIKALMVVESATRKPFYVPFGDYIKAVDTKAEKLPM